MNPHAWLNKISVHSRLRGEVSLVMSSGALEPSKLDSIYFHSLFKPIIRTPANGP
jgi:hypothetical protein